MLKNKNDRVIRIAFDVMGHEGKIEDAIEASRELIKRHKNTRIVLVGDKDIIFPLMKYENEFEIFHTKSFISQTDTLVTMRNKSDNSMQMAINLVKEGHCDGVLSAGNSGVFVGKSYLSFGLLDPIKKPAFMPCIPTTDHKFFNLLDCGANVSAKSTDLVLFAVMGSIYASAFYDKPRVNILNIGTEDKKGTSEVIEANNILKNIPDINYQGFIEPRYLLERASEVVVTNGFVGNIVLKTLEGTAKTFGNLLKKNFKRPQNWLGYFFSVGVLKSVVKGFDYKNHAGAIVLGLQKLAIKTHSSADKKQFYSALEMLWININNNLIERLKAGLAEINLESLVESNE